MKRHTSVGLILLLFVSFAILPGTPVPIVPAHAQTSPQPWTQAVQLAAPPPIVRTIDDMLADQALNILPPAPLSVVPIPFRPDMNPILPPAPLSVVPIPFRPGMDPAAYAAAKAAAPPFTPGTRRPPAPMASDPAPAAPQLGGVNCDGKDEFTAMDGSGNAYYPPDDDGAIGFAPSAGIFGTKEVVAVTNVHVTVYDANAAGTNCATSQLFDSTLNAFFGYSNAQLFDPRVVHDDLGSRWIVTAIAFQEASGAQYQFIAASTTDDALGPWYISAIDTKTLAYVCPTCFWDFDQVGYSDQMITITANLFGGSSPIRAFALFLDKAHLYNGLGFGGCYAMDEFFNWAPVKVLDHNPETWLVSANANYNSLLHLAGWTSTAGTCPALTHDIFVSIPTWNPPPNAPQPDSVYLIDTADGRFLNRSTQYGEPGLGQQTVLWNVHTVGTGPFTQTRLYRIVVCPDPLAGCTAQPTATSADFSASGTSFDWNPSIAVNSSGTVFATWSSDDVFGVNVQVRAGSCDGSLSVCSPGPGVVVFQSSGPLYGNPESGGVNIQRWGDYSSIVIDPTAPGSAFGFNEEIDNPHQGAPGVGGSWGTRLFSISGP